VQRMPWPRSDGTVASDWLGHETWILDKQNFPWMQGEEGEPFFQFHLTATNSTTGKVNIGKIHHVKNCQSDGWITDDGRAYFVQHRQSSPSPSSPSQSTNKATIEASWSGLCIYPSDQSSVSATHTPLSKALEIAINTAFSVIAVGLESGGLLCISFPSLDGTHPPPAILTPPEAPIANKKGRVTALEWTSDGYALAVGWEFGWAIVSVGGRFLAWSSETTNSNPGLVSISSYHLFSQGNRLQDLFMHGVTSMVSMRWTGSQP